MYVISYGMGESHIPGPLYLRECANVKVKLWILQILSSKQKLTGHTCMTPGQRFTKRQRAREMAFVVGNFARIGLYDIIACWISRWLRIYNAETSANPTRKL